MGAALSESLMLASGNYVPSATLTSSPLWGGSLLSAAQDEQLWTFCRLSLLGTPYLQADLGQVREIALFAIIKTNFSFKGRYRVRAANSVAALTGVPLYDSGWVSANPAVSGYGVEIWGEFEWGEVDAVPVLGKFNQNHYHPFTQKTSARYVRVDFEDIGNPFYPDDPYLQFAELWISNAYQPSMNTSYGAEVLPVDETAFKKAPSGVRHYDTRIVRMRTIQFAFELLPKRELMTQLLGPVFMKEGIVGKIIAILEPTQPDTFYYSAVYGNLKDIPASQYSYWVRMATAMEVQEAV